MDASSDGFQVDKCDYLQVRCRQDKKARAKPSYVQSMKKWKRKWVVLHVELSPSECYLCYCGEEKQWLLKENLHKLPLADLSDVNRIDNTLELVFSEQPSDAAASLEIGFQSLTKTDEWFSALKQMQRCHHVDLVRCPHHAELEAQYIFQVAEQTLFRVWSLEQTRLCWEWHMRHVRRMHYHRSVRKLELEVGRKSETGEGIFFFTGASIDSLFEQLKEAMKAVARIYDARKDSVSRSLSTSADAEADQVDDSVVFSPSSVDSPLLPHSPLSPPSHGYMPLLSRSREQVTAATYQQVCRGSPAGSYTHYPSPSPSPLVAQRSLGSLGNSQPQSSRDSPLLLHSENSNSSLHPDCYIELCPDSRGLPTAIPSSPEPDPSSDKYMTMLPAAHTSAGPSTGGAPDQKQRKLPILPPKRS